MSRGLAGAALARHPHRFASPFAKITMYVRPLITRCLGDAVPNRATARDQARPEPTHPIAFVRVMGIRNGDFIVRHKFRVGAYLWH